MYVRETALQTDDSHHQRERALLAYSSSTSQTSSRGRSTHTSPPPCVIFPIDPTSVACGTWWYFIDPWYFEDTAHNPRAVTISRKRIRWWWWGGSHKGRKESRDTQATSKPLNERKSCPVASLLKLNTAHRGFLLPHNEDTATLTRLLNHTRAGGGGGGGTFRRAHITLHTFRTSTTPLPNIQFRLSHLHVARINTAFRNEQGCRVCLFVFIDCVHFNKSQYSPTPEHNEKKNMQNCRRVTFFTEPICCQNKSDQIFQ